MDDMEYDEFSETRLMPISFSRCASFSLYLPSFFFSCIFAHSDIQTRCLYQADLAIGDPINQKGYAAS